MEKKLWTIPPVRVEEAMSVVLALTLTFMGVSLAVVEPMIYVVSMTRIGWAS